MKPCAACHPLSRCEFTPRPAENQFDVILGGTIGDHELMHAHLLVMRDENFRANSGILFDLCAVDFWGISAAFLTEMGHLPGLAPGNRRAFVALPGLGQSILHFLRVSAPRGRVQIFNNTQAAEAWLLAPNRPHPAD